MCFTTLRKLKAFSLIRFTVVKIEKLLMFKFYLAKFCNYEREWSVSTVIHYVTLYYTIF